MPRALKQASPSSYSHSPTQAAPYGSCGADDLELLMWARALLRHWRGFAGAMLVCVVAAAGVLASTETLYESVAVVKIGRSGAAADKLLESPDVLVQRLKQEYRVGDDSEGPRRPPLISDVKGVPGATACFSITARAASADEAQSFLTGVVNKLMAEHRGLFDATREERAGRIEALRAQAAALGQQVEAALRSASNAPAGSPETSTVNALSVSMLLGHKQALEQQAFDLQQAMSDLEMQPTRSFRAATLTKQPMQPRPALTLALGSLAGIVLGTIAVFVVVLVRGETRLSMASASTGLSGDQSTASHDGIELRRGELTETTRHPTGRASAA